MAQEVGARLWHMANMVYADIDFRYPQGVQVFGSQRGIAAKGVIMVGNDGTRFMNEADKSHHGKSHFHGDIVQTPFTSKVWAIMDQEIINMGRIHGQFSEDNSEEIASGWILKAETLEELAGMIGVPAENLQKTIDLNNEMIDRGEDILFGRDIKTMKKFADGPFYAIEMVPAVVNTQGGPERTYELAENEYIGYGQGMGGVPIVVKVTMNGEDIVSVTVLSHAETPGVSDRAQRVMPERIAEADFAEVDAVSGGTVTSHGIMQAVKDALDK